MKDESLDNSVVTLFSRRWAVRRIARELGVSRNRVKRILLRHQARRDEEQPPLSKPCTRASKLDAYKEYIKELLQTFTTPPPTCQRIFELLREKGYDGGITLVKDYIATCRPKRKAEPIFTVETAPGQRGQHDWSEYEITFTAIGETHTVIFFSFILSYSRRQYLEVVPDKTQATLFRALINAANYFGGVPKEIKSDNQKACVDRWEVGQPIFNEKYLQFATHYQFRPLTIRPGKPRENLKVERPFYYVETNFLNARTFRDRDDLKRQLTEWLLATNDQRLHRTTRRKPIDMYQEELPHLGPLPKQPFDTSRVVYRIVNREACIEYDGYFYAVLPSLLFESCPVRITHDEVLIYSPACELVAIHKLAETGRVDRYVGRPLEPRGKPPVISTPEVIARLETFGPVMATFIQEIKKHKPRNYHYHLRSILALKLYYEVEDILMAVERALKFRVFEARAIESFLATNAKKRNEPELMPKNKDSHVADDAPRGEF
jgi:transposase